MTHAATAEAINAAYSADPAVAGDVAGGGGRQRRGRLLMAVATQMAVFPLFGIRVTLSANLAIGAVFTIMSIARSYLLRRLFEPSSAWAQTRSRRPETDGG
jgi:hypothetical protein